MTPTPDPDSDSRSTTETLEAAEPRKKKRKVTPKPVIRVVSALASPEPAVVLRDQLEIKRHLDELTAFDVWLAGLSDETFS